MNLIVKRAKMEQKIEIVSLLSSGILFVPDRPYCFVNFLQTHDIRSKGK